jgi:hypothetical protein
MPGPVFRYPCGAGLIDLQCERCRNTWTQAVPKGVRSVLCTRCVRGRAKVKWRKR